MVDNRVNCKESQVVYRVIWLAEGLRVLAEGPSLDHRDDLR